MVNVQYYTDGSYNTKTDCGAFAYVAYIGNTTFNVESSYKRGTSALEMEIKAIRWALKNAHAHNFKDITINTDCSQIVTAVNEGHCERWFTEGVDVAYKHEWNMLAIQLTTLNRKGVKIEFKHVLGHDTNQRNNRVDAIAKKERRRLEDDVI